MDRFTSRQRFQVAGRAERPAQQRQERLYPQDQAADVVGGHGLVASGGPCPRRHVVRTGEQQAGSVVAAVGVGDPVRLVEDQ